ncbi:MAG TPA: hypothetical protein VK507_13220 [Iamia sp.]|nr:hypothetical protein [Iamia sp.]
MPKLLPRDVAQEILAKQQIVDLDTSLSELINKVGAGGDAGYWVIAFDRYALVVESTAQPVTLEARRNKLAVLNSPAFDLNMRLSELSKMAFDSKVDEVGFNLVAWDKVVLLTHMPSPEEQLLT